MRILDGAAAEATILRRVHWDELAVPQPLLDRLAATFGEPVTPDEAVRRILHDVRERGDAAVRDWSAKVDGVQPPALVVSRRQAEAALAALDADQPQVVTAMRLAVERVERFHRRQFLTDLQPFARTEEFQWQIEHALALEPYQSLSVFGNRLEAHRSVMSSILCFADSPNDYGEAVSRAIGLGDDVDTLAAMAGTLVGNRRHSSQVS